MEGFNLAIIGKSGVGKSSLLNYLFNKDLSETGSGKPVTKPGFHYFSDLINGKKVNIYDSWGIEAGKTDLWLRDLNHFLEDKKSPNFKEWIHTVIFCLSAEGKRIEDFEKNIFRRIKSEHLNPIIVITKSDLDKDKSFYEAVKKEFMTDQVIEICSVRKEFGLGTNKKISEKYGNDNLIQTIIFNSTKSFKSRFALIKSKIIRNRSTESLMALKPKVSKIIDSYSISFNWIGNINESTVKTILERTQVLIENYDRETNEKIQQLIKDANQFYTEQFESIFYGLTTTKTFSEKKYFKNDNLGDYINSHSFFAMGPKGYLYSLLLGPVGLIAMAYIRNRGISRKDLLEKIENRIKEYYHY
ncbi:GTPase domain-containing protein [Flavobacterium sp. CSZ]|uniref:GTPase n=1 Tax=Flavobacterium sp. CSZ TaxID=2783791 RepID=UPI00188BB8DB|nr:GTPase domain-containing protein [Flavobacterium sp. CSZ]MBF4487878.1 GTPase domain-containing protein [Flavobacterium sp. CSZ]